MHFNTKLVRIVSLVTMYYFKEMWSLQGSYQNLSELSFILHSSPSHSKLIFIMNSENTVGMFNI